MYRDDQKNHTPETTDPSQNYMSRSAQPLDALFYPKSVALIGAKDDLGSVGRTMTANLLNDAFKGRVYPVNPKREEVLGIKAYPSVADIPEIVDLAVIVTPAKTVPSVMRECAAAGVRSAIVISAGFKETGPEGLSREEELVSIARAANIPVIGPNCLGIMNPLTGLNATFAKGIALPGNIAFISQSGAMCTAVLDWSFKEHIGFSSFVSIGSMADIDWGHLIRYLGGDPETKSILIYMETVGDTQSFMTAAREVALEKPIIVIKGGRSPAAAQAAASHTGSLAGSDEVFDAALARAGVLRVDTISELFDMASVLARQPLPKGPNLGIVTNAGGPSVLATDAVTLNGGGMAKLSESGFQELNAALPPAWSHGNPVDLLGDAGPDRYELAVRVLTKDTNVDGILVILSPQDVTDPVSTAECLRSYAKIDKPILASWMGGDTVNKGIHILTQAKIPTFEYPDDAAWAFAKMWKYSQNLINLYETPTLEEGEEESIPPGSSEIIKKALKEKRTLLDEFESKEFLAGYGIPVVETVIARSREEAMSGAEKIGFPTVVKLFSQTITHKSDVGGVILNIKSKEEVGEAYDNIRRSVTKLAGEKAFEGVTVQKMIKLDGYELILGSFCDEQFGPVLLFGMGGQLVEIFRDTALALPPLNSNLAMKLMEQTKIFEALKGVRGKESVDIDKLTKILVCFSRLIVENPWIKELDINPLLTSPEGIIALDARIVLHEPGTPPEKLSIPSIRPYPSQYIKQISLSEGTDILLRPIKAEDEPAVVQFHKELSENSVRQRYFEFLTFDERTTHERMIRICFNDYDRELALIALTKEEGKKEIIGIARLIKIQATERARMTMTIVDKFHGKGLGNAMLTQLIYIARKEYIKEIVADVLAENSGMLHLCKKHGFTVTYPDKGNVAECLLRL